MAAPFQDAAHRPTAHAQHEDRVGRRPFQRAQGVQAVGHREGGAVLQPQGAKPPPGLFQRRRAHIADQPVTGPAEQERRTQPAVVRADVGKHPRARSQRHGGGKPPVQHGRAAKNPVSQGSP